MYISVIVSMGCTDSHGLGVQTLGQIPEQIWVNVFRSSSFLNVYAAQIGPRKLVVAAPNEQAALKAWNASENLFSTGAARLVTDEAISALALRTPGQPVAVVESDDFDDVRQIIWIDDHRLSRPLSAKARETAVRTAACSDLSAVEQELSRFRINAALQRARILRQWKLLQGAAMALEEDLAEEESRLLASLDDARRSRA